MPEISDMVTTVYPKIGAVVSTVGCLHVVQDLQGRLVEVALAIVTAGKMKLFIGADTAVRRRAEGKLKANRVARYRARKAANQRALYARKRTARPVTDPKKKKKTARQVWYEMRRLAATSKAS